MSDNIIQDRVSEAEYALEMAQKATIPKASIQCTNTAQAYATLALVQAVIELTQTIQKKTKG